MLSARFSRLAPLSAAVAAVIVTGTLFNFASADSLTDREGRFAIVQLEDGIARVDRTTGAVDRCRDVAGKLVCTLAADERQAWQAEMDVMKEKLTAMETRLAAIDKKPSPENSSIDSVEEMEKAWTIAETFFRRFFNLVESLKPGAEKPEAL